MKQKAFSAHKINDSGTIIGFAVSKVASSLTAFEIAAKVCSVAEMMAA